MASFSGGTGITDFYIHFDGQEITNAVSTISLSFQNLTITAQETANAFTVVGNAFHTVGNTIYETIDYTAHGEWIITNPFNVPKLPAERVAVVNRRAEELLLSHLTPEQRAAWQKEAYLDVRSEHGERYRIKRGQSHNVYRLDQTGRELRKYCAYGADPGGTLPMGDHVLVQLLALKFNEREFLRHANTWDHEGKFVGLGADAQ